MCWREKVWPQDREDKHWVARLVTPLSRDGPPLWSGQSPHSSLSRKAFRTHQCLDHYGVLKCLLELILLKVIWCWWLVLMAWHSVPYCFSDWDTNCLGCECKWSSGKKVANCTNAKLNSIPQNLHAEVQVLILDNNFISSLGENIFIRNLPNLQKISLRHCGIKTINEKAFNGLKILVEVDLSFNNITKECRFKT